MNRVLPHRAALASLLLPLVACAASARPAPAPPALAPSPSASVSASASASAAPVASAPAIKGPLQPFEDVARAGLCSAAQLADAGREVLEIDRLITRLPDDVSPAPDVTTRITGLLGSPCFRNKYLVYNLDTQKIHTAQAVVIRRWWETGRTFLTDTLRHANAVHLAPSVPRLLAPELLPPDAPLRAILCPAASVACDPLAEGARLDLGRELERLAIPSQQSRHSTYDRFLMEECARQPPKSPDDDPLVAYVACVKPLVPRHTVLPLGRFRSPKGWLVMRGRRGHHQFCDEIRAYDLVTGAAYIASRCSGLVLGQNGHVNHTATGQQSQMRTQVGRLSVDALRRLALVLWLKGSFDTNVQRYAEFSLPSGVSIPTSYRHGTESGSSWATSGQTRIAFSVVDGGKELHTGQFTWPEAHDVGDQIADDLIVSAEATFQPGCAPAALPAALAQVAPVGGVSPIDASAASLRESAEAIGKAMAGLRAGRVCRAR